MTQPKLLEGAVTRTDIQPVQFSNAAEVAEDLKGLLEATTASEVHLAFHRQEGLGWQVQGVLIQPKEDQPKTIEAITG